MIRHVVSDHSVIMSVRIGSCDRKSFQSDINKRGNLLAAQN